MPRTETVLRRRGASSSRPRLVTSFGERISSPDTAVMCDTDTEEAGERSTADLDKRFDITKVVLDRDRLRGLRNSEAATEIAAKALGDDMLSDIKRTDQQVQKVNPYDLYFEAGHNPRDFASVAMRERVVELTRSIAARGVRKPLDVYVKDGRLYVNGGETRWRATLHAICFLNVRVERIPVIISQGENATDRKISQWIDNDQWQFQPLESGKLFRDAVALGAEIVEIARRIGKPTTYVQTRIRLLEMPQWLIDRVRGNDIAADTAFNKIWMAAGEDDRRAKEMLKQAVAAANETRAGRVMPKHIRKTRGGTVRTLTVSSMRDELGRILRRHDREAFETAIGDSDTERLYQMAKLSEPPRRGRRR